LVQPFIPNEADAFHADQAEPDSVDWEIKILAFQRTGVKSGCAVTESSPAAQTVDIAAGEVLLSGEHITVSAQADKAVTAADGSNPRFDLISINSSGTAVVTAGTAASQPVYPDIPASSVPLAVLYVPASDNTHANNQITDKRILLDDSRVDYSYVDPVRDFNCPTDGTSDCLAAFDAAAAAAQPSAGGPGRMQIPAGITYLLSDTFKQLKGVSVYGSGTGKGTGDQDIGQPEIKPHSSWVGGAGSYLWQFGADGTGNRFDLRLEGLNFSSTLTGADFVEWLIRAPGKLDTLASIGQLTFSNNGGGGIWFENGGINAWMGDFRCNAYTKGPAFKITPAAGGQGMHFGRIAWHTETANPAVEGCFLVDGTNVINNPFILAVEMFTAVEHDNTLGLQADRGIIATLQAAATGGNPYIVFRCGSINVKPNTADDPLFWIGRGDGGAAHDNGFIIDVGTIVNASTTAELIANTTIPSPAHNQMAAGFFWAPWDTLTGGGSPEITKQYVGALAIRNLGVGEDALRTASAHGDGVLTFADVSTAPTDAPATMAILFWDDTANELKLVNDAGTVYTIDKT
jgi:hypothetical protein